MMGIERRAGKDKPVITKALTELDGPNFKAYEAVRDKWALLDAYRNVGPIQFDGPETDFIPYLVKPPVIADLIRETEEIERAEQATFKTFVPKTIAKMSELEINRSTDPIDIPSIMKSKNFTLSVLKEFKAT